MLDQYLAELQQLLGVPMPAELATLYRLTGGEPKRYGDAADENLGRGVLFGSELMTLREIVDTARTPGNWREDGLDEDYEDPDAPVILLEPTKRREGHRHRLWLDNLDNAGGNYVSSISRRAPRGPSVSWSIAGGTSTADSCWPIASKNSSRYCTSSVSRAACTSSRRLMKMARARCSSGRRRYRSAISSGSAAWVYLLDAVCR